MDNFKTKDECAWKPKTSVDSLEKTETFCPCPESQQNSSVAQPEA
jgi:hypothetical protein